MMSTSEKVTAIDGTSELIGGSEKSTVELWFSETIYQLMTICPFCERWIDEYFRNRTQYRRKGTAKCPHCGRLFELRGERHDERKKDGA